jgi:hypothetical protein
VGVVAMPNPIILTPEDLKHSKSPYLAGLISTDFIYNSLPGTQSTLIRDAQTGNNYKINGQNTFRRGKEWTDAEVDTKNDALFTSEPIDRKYLALSETEKNALLHTYVQDLSGYGLKILIVASMSSGEYLINCASSCEHKCRHNCAHPSKEPSGHIFKEAKATGSTQVVFESTNKNFFAKFFDNKIPNILIEGSITTRFVLHDADSINPYFKLESIECSNELMRDFCMKNDVTIFNHLPIDTFFEPSLFSENSHIESNEPNPGDSATSTPGSSTVYNPKVKPSFFKRIVSTLKHIGNWFDEHPFIKGLMIGVGIAVVAAVVVVGIVALAPVLPFLAHAALFIGAASVAVYGVLKIIHITGALATAAITATHVGTVGLGTGAAVKLTASCTTAKLAKTLGAGVGNTPPKPDNKKDQAQQENNPSCLAGLQKKLSGVANRIKNTFSPRP